MYEKQQILSVNSHKEILQISSDLKTLAEIFEQLQIALDKSQLAWPQILSTENRNSAFYLYLSTSSEELSALSKAIEQHTSIKVAKEKYASVSMTCHGAVASNLAFKALKHFKQKNIEVYNLIPQALSLSFIVKQSQITEAIQCAHDFVV